MPDGSTRFKIDACTESMTSPDGPPDPDVATPASRRNPVVFGSISRETVVVRRPRRSRAA